MRAFRKLLWPFSLIYGFITFLRNKCYDSGLFEVYTIPKKSICVGNLSTGGTGKTPHVAYLAEYFSDKVETTILSRGYGRKTKGFILLDGNQSSLTVGDEPLLYSTIFDKKVHVAVCEKRKEGVEKIQKLFPLNELILLDDAFQHRAVKAGFSILLTDFNSPYSKDFMLPAGNLREWKSGKNRADCVIVSKCPDELSEINKINLANELKVHPEKIFFSKIVYGAIKAFGKTVQTPKNVLLVSGIANPKPLIEFLSDKFTIENIQFKDHHVFNEQDIQLIHQKFDTFVGAEKIILTTEKDFMRLKDFTRIWNLEDYPWYYQPITVEIDKELQFKSLIDQYVNTI